MIVNGYKSSKTWTELKTWIIIARVIITVIIITVTSNNLFQLKM